MGRRDHSATLVAIRVPTLVLCGRQDALTPLVDHQAMAAGISDSRLVVVEDCGHLATIERPAPVNAALRRWLLAESSGRDGAATWRRSEESRVGQGCGRTWRSRGW